MTLHWWMHWFWVTTLLLALSDKGGAMPLDISVAPSVVPPDSERGARAMYVQNKPAPTPAPAGPLPPQSKLTLEALADTKPPGPSPPPASEAAPALANDTANVTKVAEQTETEHKDNMTLQKIVAVDTTPHEEAAEHEWPETAPPAPSGNLLQASLPAGRTEDKEQRMQAGAIAGITLGAVAAMALGSVAAALLYRRRYLNTPQTLNDKCSNPDSSGYLDDSTVRENSEEMYSLDNDSFLNSLEAMTIQNYWTESVKHSKL